MYLKDRELQAHDDSPAPPCSPCYRSVSSVAVTWRAQGADHD